jgi:hypothetical protein
MDLVRVSLPSRIGLLGCLLLPHVLGATPEYGPVVRLDPHLSMRATATGLHAAHTLLRGGIDHHLPMSWLDESRPLGRAAGLAGRLARGLLVDLPLDYGTIVLLHEVGGHGARYRELGVDDIDYGMDWPPPYGGGGGHASVEMGSRYTGDEVLSVWTGGLEAHTVLQRELRWHWLATDRVAAHEALLYVWSFQIAMKYVQDTDSRLARIGAPGRADNDPQAWVRLVNRRAGHTDVDNLPFTIDDLKDRYILGAADSFLFSVAIAAGVGFWSGDGGTALRLLPLGPVDFLPALRTTLTPFGTETHTEWWFRHHERRLLLDLRRGDTTFHCGWYGIGLWLRPAGSAPGGGADIDVEAHLWRQPQLHLTSDDSRDARDIGGLLRLTLWRTLRRVDGPPLRVFVEVGAKSAGFIEGEPLAAAWLLSLGLRLP